MAELYDGYAYYGHTYSAMRHTMRDSIGFLRHT